jgi:hypothetical protein
MSGDILFPDEAARPEGNHVRSHSSMLTCLSPGEEVDEIHANLGDITNMMVVGGIMDPTGWAAAANHVCLRALRSRGHVEGVVSISLGGGAALYADQGSQM